MKRYIDLSVTVGDTTLSPPSTNMKLDITPHRRGPGFWQVSSVRQSLHTGAHIDSPLHVFKDGITTAEIGLDQVMGEAIVIDMSFVGPNHEITIDDLRRGGADDVRAGDIVLLRTDWPRRCPVASERFWKDAPYTGRGACEWLVARGVKAVGYDYPPDYCIRTSIFSPETKIAREECTTHHVFFPAGVTVIEYLTNLDQIGAPRCRFIALPLRVTGADGSPTRP